MNIIASIAQMPLTWLIIASTSIISILAFPQNVASIDSARKPEWFHKFLFNANDVAENGNYYRLFSYGFIHANWMHLIFNMLTLYFFGDIVENAFKAMYPMFGGTIYVAFYIVAIAVSSLFDLIKYKDAPYYNAVGASGAVSAILFAAILFNPDMKLRLILLPIPITAWIFGILYLFYSAYMAKRGRDNIGHNAHFWGAIFGFFLPIILKPALFVRFFSLVF